MDKNNVGFDEFGVPVDNTGKGGKIFMAIIGAMVGLIIGGFVGFSIGLIVGPHPNGFETENAIEEGLFGCIWGMILGSSLAMTVYDRLNHRIRSIKGKIGMTIIGAAIGSGIGAILMAYIEVIGEFWPILFIGEIIGIRFVARIFDRQKGATTDKQDRDQLI